MRHILSCSDTNVTSWRRVDSLGGYAGELGVHERLPRPAPESEIRVTQVVASGGEVEPAKLLAAPKAIEPSPSGRIEIALADGSRVVADREVDAVALSRVLGVLERR